MSFEAKFLESEQPGDYEPIIDALSTGGYNVIITVGSPMGNAMASKAKQYPDIKFGAGRNRVQSLFVIEFRNKRTIVTLRDTVDR